MSTHAISTRAVVLAAAMTAATVLGVSACEREARRFRDTLQTTTHPETVPSTSLTAGAPPAHATGVSPFATNAYGLAEGKRLYTAFNCSGCHATAGGGGIGPPLRDDLWIYGYTPAQIYSSIVQGRPNGMPSFAGKLPEQQIWQLVAYLESLNAAVPRDVSTSRSDDLNAARPEMRTERLQRIQSGHR